MRRIRDGVSLLLDFGDSQFRRGSETAGSSDHEPLLINHEGRKRMSVPEDDITI